MLDRCASVPSLLSWQAPQPDRPSEHIEKDAALERRFQKIFIQPPSVDETIEILIGLKQKYGRRKMQFNDRLVDLISYQHVYHLCRKAVHRPSRIYTQELETIATLVLDRVKHSRFDNS